MSTVTQQSIVSTVTQQPGVSTVTQQPGVSTVTQQSGVSTVTQQSGVSTVTQQSGVSIRVVAKTLTIQTMCKKCGFPLAVVRKYSSQKMLCNSTRWVSMQRVALHFLRSLVFMFTVYPKELGCIAYLRVTVCVCDSVRGKTLQLLDSNPVQFLLCVLVLIDAAVVVAEILIDLHAVKSTSSAS